MIWQVPRCWEGQTAVILAGGPSLFGFDPRQLVRENLRVITINDSWRIFPVADVLYFQDQDWWTTQIGLNRRSLGGADDFASVSRYGFWVSGNRNFLNHPVVHCLGLSGQFGYDPDPRFLRHGSNSGYQAIHLAAQFGAARILLLGYDMHVQGGKSHWHNEPRPGTPFAQRCRDSFLPNFTHADQRGGPSLVQALRDRGVEVINCTPGSALTCWPMMSLEAALEISSGARMPEPAALH